MPNIQIPEVYRPGIARLASLTEEESSELLSALTGSKPVSDSRKMAAAIRSSVPSVSDGDLERVISALVALCVVRVVNNTTVEAFVGTVLDSLSRYRELREVNSEVLRRRLTIFLNIDQLILSAKAGSLQRDQPATFIGAHSTTDIRPVFTDSIEAPQGAVLVHTLKISYVHENDTKEFFVAMDDDDLETLQKVLNRSQEKARALRNLIEKAELTSLDGR